jgi:hypothetical protein
MERAIRGDGLWLDMPNGADSHGESTGSGQIGMVTAVSVGGRMSVERKKSGDPFPFVGHGVGYARKRIQCYLGFETEVLESAHSEIERHCPPPLACFFKWTSRGLCFGSDDALHRRIIKTYPGKPVVGTSLPGTEQWAALARATEEWIRAIDERWAVAYAIWPPDQETGHDPSPWHERSMEQIPSLLIDLCEKGDDDAQWFAESIAMLWRAQMQVRAKSEQEAAQANLTAQARAALEAMQLWWTPVEPLAVDERRELEDHEMLQVWRGTPRDTGSLREAFDRVQGERFPDTKPVSFRYDLLHAIREEGTAEEGLDLCVAVLAQPDGAVDWEAFRAQFLIALGRLSEAKALLPAALLDHIARGGACFDNEELLALCDYYLALGDQERAEIVIHGGARLGSFLKLIARAEGRSINDKPPPRVGTRFAKLYDEWLTPVWDPHSLSRDQLWHCQRAFERLARRPLAAKRKDVDDLRANSGP